MLSLTFGNVSHNVGWIYGPKCLLGVCLLPPNRTDFLPRVPLRKFDEQMRPSVHSAIGDLPGRQISWLSKCPENGGTHVEYQGKRWSLVPLKRDCWHHWTLSFATCLGGAGNLEINTVRDANTSLKALVKYACHRPNPALSRCSRTPVLRRWCADPDKEGLRLLAVVERRLWLSTLRHWSHCSPQQKASRDTQLFWPTQLYATQHLAREITSFDAFSINCLLVTSRFLFNQMCWWSKQHVWSGKNDFCCITLPSCWFKPVFLAN